MVFGKVIHILPAHKNRKKKKKKKEIDEKNGEYYLPPGNFSSTTVCDSIALCYGRLIDNVALIQLQMNRQDSGIKNEVGL